MAPCTGTAARSATWAGTAPSYCAGRGWIVSPVNLRGGLTLLDRKRLELAHAMATQPNLILLDEIAGGLTPGECDALIEVVNEVKAAGTTIPWVEHIINALVRVVERLVVLNFGRVIADGPPKSVLADASVREIYMGFSPGAAADA